MKYFKVLVGCSGRTLAENLIAGSQAGLLHLRAICRVLGMKIRVWDRRGQLLGIYGTENNSYGSIGFNINDYDVEGYAEDCSLTEEVNEDLGNLMKHLKSNFEDDDRQEIRKSLREGVSTSVSRCSMAARDEINILEIEYQEPERKKPGHWTVKRGGSEDKPISGNNCLFEAICRQLEGWSADKLRLLTAEAVSEKTVVIEEGFPQFSGTGCLLLGGAKYDGKDPSDASDIIDKSQGTRGHAHAARAHPRGHSSHPTATGDTDSVENYSRNSRRDFPKSGWMSREDQNKDMHILLQTEEARWNMQRLNSGETRVVIKMIPSFEIRMGEWAEGVMFRGPLIAERITILLQHHEGQHNNEIADVQVFTCYPEAPKSSKNYQLTIHKTIPVKRSLSPDTDEEKGKIQPTKKKRRKASSKSKI